MGMYHFMAWSKKAALVVHCTLVVTGWENGSCYVAFESSASPSCKLAVQHLPGSRSSGNHPLSAGTRTTTWEDPRHFFYLVNKHSNQPQPHAAKLTVKNHKGNWSIPKFCADLKYAESIHTTWHLKCSWTATQSILLIIVPRGERTETNVPLMALEARPPAACDTRIAVWRSSAHRSSAHCHTVCLLRLPQ